MHTDTLSIINNGASVKEEKITVRKCEGLVFVEYKIEPQTVTNVYGDLVQ